MIAVVLATRPSAQSACTTSGRFDCRLDPIVRFVQSLALAMASTAGSSGALGVPSNTRPPRRLDVFYSGPARRWSSRWFKYPVYITMVMQTYVLCRTRDIPLVSKTLIEGDAA